MKSKAEAQRELQEIASRGAILLINIAVVVLAEYWSRRKS